MKASELSNGCLVEQLGSVDPGEVMQARDLLLQRGSSVLDALTAGIDHKNSKIRMWCAGLMDHLGDERCLKPLTKALTDPSPDVRRHAVHGIGCQICKPSPLAIDGVALLIERAENDASIRVRRVATHMLGQQHHDIRAVLALEKMLSSETDSQLLSRARAALKALQASVLRD